MKPISLTMARMLDDVERGWGDGTRPFQISNTNSTAGALEARGLIVMADDQSRARRTLCWAWLLTAAGRMALRERKMIRVNHRPYRKHIFYPAVVNDDTVRCISCGQIDEPEYHDMDECVAVRRDLAEMHDPQPEPTI